MACQPSLGSRCGMVAICALAVSAADTGCIQSNGAPELDESCSHVGCGAWLGETSGSHVFPPQCGAFSRVTNLAPATVWCALLVRYVGL